MNRPNFMLITADDMNWDAVGLLGVQQRGQRQILTDWPREDCGLTTVM